MADRITKVHTHPSDTEGSTRRIEILEGHSGWGPEDAQVRIGLGIYDDDKHVGGIHIGMGTPMDAVDTLARMAVSIADTYHLNLIDQELGVHDDEDSVFVPWYHAVGRIHRNSESVITEVGRKLTGDIWYKTVQGGNGCKYMLNKGSRKILVLKTLEEDA